MKVDTQSNVAVEYFCSLPPHETQRDTERHAAKAKNMHLSGDQPDHMIADQSIVKTARYNGVVTKLDGHTRAHLWAIGSLKKPSALTVIHYDCANRDEYLDAYKQQDNMSAAENTQDLFFGAVRGWNMVPSYSVARSGFSAVSNFVYLSGLPAKREITREAVQFWKDELEHINEKNRSSNKAASGTISAEMASLKMFGVERSDKFWDAFYSGLGTKTGGKMDAVEALDRSLSIMRRDHKNGGRFGAIQTMSKAIRAVQAYEEGTLYTFGIKRTFDVKSLLIRHGLVDELRRFLGYGDLRKKKDNG